MKRFLATLMCMAASVSWAAADAVRDADAHPVEMPALDVVQAELLRADDGRLVIKITTAEPCDVERLRFMLDVDGPGRGEPSSGADFMVEGSRFYRYPEGAKDWTWDAVGSAVLITEDRTVTLVLPALSGLDHGRWVVETTKSDWTEMDRLPDEGAVEFDMARLPSASLAAKIQPEDVGELIGNMPRSLSFRLDTELKACIWKDVPAADMKMPAWQPSFMTSAIPVVLRLTDAATRESAVVAPQASATCSNATQWTGKALGIDWLLMIEPDGQGDVRVTGMLSADTDRCVRAEIGCGVDLAGWVWHDDVGSRREMSAGGIFDNAVETPYGMSRRASLYPFGLIASDQGSLVVETDPEEPRVFRISADPAQRFFGAAYELGLTRSTSNFSGRATFRCALRSGAGGDAAFRRALASFYQRNPDFAERRVPAVGLWLPFQHPSAIAGLDDFGFAFFETDDASEESEGPPVAGLLRFGYTEPWLYWLPMPDGVARTEDEAVRLMTVYGAGNDRQAEQAVSALLGAARAPDGSIAMQFMDVPWNSGARMEVNADPELRTTRALPLNRAMSEWRNVRRMIAEDGLDGVYLDSMASATALDYNPAAMAVADYPCTFASNALRPAVAMPMANYEYVAALAGALRPRGRYLMGNFACAESPFVMKYVDVAGEEIEWDVPGRFERLDDRMMNFRRAMCGRKPLVFLLNTAFEKLTADSVRRYFEDCMFWAVQPGFFARDGAKNYWSTSLWYNRDRNLFKTYGPVIRRLAEAGWSPQPFVRVAAGTVQLENYGSITSRVLHLALRNTNDAPAACRLQFAKPDERLLVVNPLSGECRLVDSNSPTCDLVLPPECVQVRDVVPVPMLAAEQAFAGAWNSGNGEAAALQKTLQSIHDEAGMGAACSITIPEPAVRQQTNAFELRVSNEGSEPLVVSDLKVIASRQFRPFEASPTTVRAGDDMQWPGYFLADDVAENPWLEIQWTLVRGGVTQFCSRMVRPVWVDPVVFRTPATNIVCGADAAVIEVSARNFSSEPQTIRFRWDGDFKRGKQEELLAPQSAKRVRLPVEAGRTKEGQVFVEADVAGERVYRQWFDLSFTGP